MKQGLVVVFLLVAVSLFYQESNSGSAPVKVWIFFKDRPFLLNRKLHPAQVTKFSASAIHRRELRAEVLFDESDFPPDPSYVQGIRSAGATILVESRWLNAVSALCDDRCGSRLSSIAYVSEIRPVLTYIRRNESIEEIIPRKGLMESAGSGYGQSREQLDQLKVPPVHRKGFAGQGEIVAIFDSGFRKDHVAFKNHPIVGEHDFVFGDDNVTNGGSSDSHGTSTWSCVGGAAPGKLYGPAFKSSFILAATEDIRSETQVEEDNWVAALEFADQLGATVVNSSLGYPLFYKQPQLDGKTAITTIAANSAAKKGIVVANSAGNEGPSHSTLGPPADAFNILTVGAVSSNGTIARFSSRGPTADGRLKPEVVARGVSTFVATNSRTDTFGFSDGTSFSSPLVAGCAAVLLSAHPDWTPLQVREALMMTAGQAGHPDNTYGYGIVNLLAAFDFLPKNSIVIEHKELKDMTNVTQPFRILARIRAQRGVDPNKLFLFWKKSGASAFQRFLLTPVLNAPDKYEAFIPAQTQGTTIQYYLQADDRKGKRSRLPFGAPKANFDFLVKFSR